MRALTAHRDARGTFVELFRDEWGFCPPPPRWTLEEVDRPRVLDESVLAVVDGRVGLEVDGAPRMLDAEDPTLVAVDAGARVRGLDGPALVARGTAGDGAQAPVRGVTPPGAPPGVEVFDLPTTPAGRELRGPTWQVGVVPVQWNAVRSRVGVLRGVHCHPRHADLVCVARGRMRLGLADLRGGRVGAVTCLDLDASRPKAVAIPPGVAHGFQFVAPSLHVYAVDRTWDPADELGCRWDDPAMGIPWAEGVESISERDAGLGTAAALLDELAAAGV
jgi:dTDP-4-dehydrorhamnose 3,5-epimerase